MGDGDGEHVGVGAERPDPADSAPAVGFNALLTKLATGSSSTTSPQRRTPSPGAS
jgi:hypothetical protein